MRVEYSPDVDAAYIYFVDEIGAGGVARTVPVDPLQVPAMINLDFDHDGRLVGIEVLGASHHLPPALLAEDRRVTDG